LLSVDAVHDAYVILEIIALDGLRRWKRSKSDTSKDQVLPVACPDRADYNFSWDYSAVPKPDRERCRRRSQLHTWTTTRSVGGMHNPAPNLYDLRALNPQLMEDLRECLLAQEFFGKTGGAIRCQAVNPHTAGENRPIVCKDMVGKEVNRVSVEEVSVFGSEMLPSAVVEKDGTPEAT
jgi:hypothetical protein